MILFRYLSSHWFESLLDQRLKVSRISSFNDPFECMYRIVGEMTREKAEKEVLARLNSFEFLVYTQKSIPGIKTIEDLNQFIHSNFQVMVSSLISAHPIRVEGTLNDRETLLDEHFRVVCFSDSNVNKQDEILIWSHYADKHHGVRIGFEFPQEQILPFKVIEMQYRPDLVAIDLSLSDQTLLEVGLRQSTRTKSTSWSYEREHRLIISPELCMKEKYEDGILEFINIESDWIKRIDFGSRCDPNEIERTLKVIKEKYPKAVSFRSTYNRDTYGLEYVPI